MDAGQWCQFVLMAAVERKPYNRASPGGKQANRPAGDGNAPLLPPAAASPPEGEILAALCIDVLMSSEAEWRADFPLRGGKGTGFVRERSDLKIQ